MTGNRPSINSRWHIRHCNGFVLATQRTSSSYESNPRDNRFTNSGNPIHNNLFSPNPLHMPNNPLHMPENPFYTSTDRVYMANSPVHIPKTQFTCNKVQFTCSSHPIHNSSNVFKSIAMLGPAKCVRECFSCFVD